LFATTVAAFCFVVGSVIQYGVVEPSRRNAVFFPSPNIVAGRANDTPPATSAANLVDATTTANITLSSTPAIPPNMTRNVGFVHVGKAGGSTVETAFDTMSCHQVFRRADGHVRGPNKTELAECYKRKHRDDSPFSDQVALQLHLGNSPRLMPQIKNFTTFMYTVRNPITRMISAFNYLHPNNTKSVYARFMTPNKEIFYRSCFPQVQDLFQAVDSIYHPKNFDQTIDYDMNEPPTDTQSYAYCQYLAMAVLQAKTQALFKINVHLFYNYHYYWQYTGQMFPEKEILALRTEHMWQDIIDLDVATGGSGKFVTKGYIARSNPVAKTKRTKATREYQSMCCVLWGELDLFQKIIYRAINLTPQQKLESLQDVWHTCGIESEDQEKYQVGTSGLRLSWYEWQNAKCPPPKLHNPDQEKDSRFFQWGDVS
jgi:Sulfotransferase family